MPPTLKIIIRHEHQHQKEAAADAVRAWARLLLRREEGQTKSSQHASHSQQYFSKEGARQ